MYINLALAVDTTNSELAKALDTVEILSQILPMKILCLLSS